MSTSTSRLGFLTGQVVQEFLWDEDVDEVLRNAIEDETGHELVDEDFGDLVDGAIIWWRSDDGDTDDLADCLVDATQNFDGPGLVWVLTPKSSRPDHFDPASVESAARTAGLHATSSTVVAPDWSGTKIRTRNS
ncbi:MAG: DUF3052 domain-containing protein [Actinomycetaceae bacterium]|nr:DUF3052 domain-containing protein [Actinomycetaceae bacterium]